MVHDLHITRIAVSDYVGWSDAFDSLCQRAADGNPHMSPASVAAAAATLRQADNIVVLAAHEGSRLVGIWVLHRTRSIWSAGMPVLEAPLVPVYDISSTPVLEAAMTDEVLAALLAAIAQAPDLPRLLRLPLLPLSGATFEAFKRAADRKLCRIAIHETWERPVMLANGETGAAALARGLGSNRKKRMTQRRAFARLGELSFLRARGPDAGAAFERFLQMEDAGWKGRAGTSLLKRGNDCDYHRSVVQALAARNKVMIDALLLDGKAVAMGLLIETAGTIHYLKTTYDERHGKHSPGRILAMEMVAHIVDAPGFRVFDSGTGSAVDPDSHIWGDRRLMGHVLVSCGASGHRPALLMDRLRIWLRTHHRRLKSPNSGA